MHRILIMILSALFNPTTREPKNSEASKGYSPTEPKRTRFKRMLKAQPQTAWPRGCGGRGAPAPANDRRGYGGSRPRNDEARSNGGSGAGSPRRGAKATRLRPRRGQSPRGGGGGSKGARAREARATRARSDRGVK